MANIIMPAFARFPQEAEIIGRLLAGYGEIEYELGFCLDAALNDSETAFRTLFRVRGEKQRVDIADALMRHIFEDADLGSEYGQAIGAVGYCRRIRNQFAHCHWFDDQELGLYFFDLEKSAVKKSRKGMLQFLHVDPPLLSKQEAFFMYTEKCLTYLHKEFRKRKGKIKNHPWSMPPQEQQPPFHNPPEEHEPPISLLPT